MKTYIIIAIILACGIFLFLFLRVRRRNKLRKEGKEALDKAIKIAEAKKEDFFRYLGVNKEKFHSPETLLNLKECDKAIKEITDKMDEIDAKFDNKKIAADVDQNIDEAKAKAGPYIDFLGMEENTARLQMNASVQALGIQYKLELWSALLQMQPIYYDYLLAEILPEFKEDKDLLEKCTNFLNEELKVCTVAHKFKLDKDIDSRVAIVEMVLNRMESKEITSLIPQFGHFIHAA